MNDLESRKFQMFLRVQEFGVATKDSGGASGEPAPSSGGSTPEK